MRFVITGGDNCYCGRCGGACDRVLLEIDDEKKTYKGVAELCLGKWCWRELPIGNGWVLKRFEKCGEGEFESWGGNLHRLVHIDKDGRETDRRKVVVKNNKWGKDCEFKTYRNGKMVWDKIQNYKCLGCGEISQ